MRLRFIFVAAACVAASAASADPRGEATIRGFVSAIDALPEWSASAGAIRSEGDDTIAENLRFEGGGQSVTVSFARFRALAPDDDGGFSASQAELRDTAFRSAKLEVTIPAFAARGLAFPDPATLEVDPAEPVRSAASVYTALMKARIDEAQMPQADLVQTEPGPGEAKPLITRVRYEKLTIAEMRNGVVGSLTFGPVSTRTEGSMESHVDVAEGSAETINFGALAHVLDERNYRGGFGDGAWRPVTGQVVYSGISGTGSDGTNFTLGEVAVRNVEARQPPRPFTTRLDSLSQKGESAMDDPDEQRLAFDTLSDLFSAFRLGSVVLRDVEVTPPEADSGSGRIGTASLTALSSDGFESFAMNNVALEAPDGFARLASFNLTDFRFPEFAAYARLFELSEKGADPALRDEAIRATLSALPRFSRMSMAGFAAGLADGSPVTLDRFDVSLEKYSGPFPTLSRLSLDRLVVPEELVRLDAEAGRMLDRLDYGDLALSIRAEERWNPREARATMDFGLTIADALSLDLAYSYTGVTEDWLVSAIAAAADSGESDTEAMLTVLDGLYLESASVKVTDRSLTDRVLGYAAEKQGLNVDGPTYREQLRGALPFLLSTLIDADLARFVMKPLQDFLGGGKAFVVEAKPAAPVPLSGIAETAEREPKALIDLLGATAGTAPAE